MAKPLHLATVGLGQLYYKINNELAEQAFNDAHEVEEPAIAEGSIAEVYRVINRETGEESVIKVQKVANYVYHQAALKEEGFLRLLAGSGFTPELRGGYDPEPFLRVTHMDRVPRDLYVTYLHPNTKKQMPWLAKINFMFRALMHAQYFRQKKVIQFDSKPENMAYDENRGETFFMDFGLARTDAELPLCNFRVGSRDYRPLENTLGLPCDGSFDIWSLGCIFGELFTGTPIFDTGGAEDSRDSDIAHVKKIMEVCGPIPKRIRKTQQFIKLMGKKFNAPESRSLSLTLFQRTRQLHPEETTPADQRDVGSLTRSLVNFIPERPTALEALDHDLFKRYPHFEIVRDPSQPGSLVSIEPASGDKTPLHCTTADLTRYPCVTRNIRRAKDDTYRIILTATDGKQTEKIVKIPPHSRLTLSGTDITVQRLFPLSIPRPLPIPDRTSVR